MGKTTKISWAQATWNPWIGCQKVSEGCKFCYAETLWTRWGHDFSQVTRTADGTFYAPLHWRNPKKIFACSMSDFFHPAADIYREEAWDIIRKTSQHLYLILTKRIERVAVCLPADWDNGWPNVWLGVTTENQKRYDERAPILLNIPAKVRFVSFEPLLERITPYPARNCAVLWPDFWIIGGESGPHYRPMRLEWVRELLKIAELVGVGVFIKQLGGHPNKRTNPEEWPEDLRVQEFPESALSLDTQV